MSDPEGLRRLLAACLVQLDETRKESERRLGAMLLAGKALVEACSWVKAACKDHGHLMAPGWMLTGEGPPAFTELLAERDAALARVAELEAAAQGRCVSCGHLMHSCSECGILTDGTE